MPPFEVSRFPTDRNFRKVTVAYFFMHNLYNFFQKKYTRKQSNNIISGLHALTALVLTNTSINHLRWFSTAYFLFDLIETLRFQKLNAVQLGYIYHHLASIYLLSCDTREIPLDQIFFWGELSNVFNYPLYHYIHEKNGNHEKKIAVFKKLQKMLYAGIRLPVCTKQIIHFARTTTAPHHLYVLSPVYIMGVIWSLKILSQ